MHARRWIMLAVPLAAGAALLYAGVGARIYAYPRRVARLNSADPQQRKQAAWSVIERRDVRFETLLARKLLGGEPSADVRESYVYSLGRLNDPSLFPTIETLLNSESDGYVRAAAWLAAARSDAHRFANLAVASPVRGDDWDRIGQAQAWLALGDTRGVDVLLRVAAGGGEQLRYVASRALYRWVRPLLDVAGRWPLEARVGEGKIWPGELVAEVARRCGTLNLQAIADGISKHQRAAACVRRNQKRITDAREDLVGLLFAQ